MTKITTLFMNVPVTYTTSMSLFVSATPPPRVKTTNIHAIRLLFAGAIAVSALLQLFAFEDFPERLITVGITPSLAPLLATSLVVSEVFALPFILRLRLSPAFRAFSMVVGWVAVLKLLGVAVLENIYLPDGLDALFGATLPLPVGMWTICAVLALCVLAGWTSWGMWPFAPKK